MTNSRAKNHLVKKQKQLILSSILAIALFVHFSCRKKVEHTEVIKQSTPTLTLKKEAFIGVPEIRVAVKKKATSARIQVTGSRAQISDQNGKFLGTLSPFGSITIKNGLNGLTATGPIHVSNIQTLKIHVEQPNGVLQLDGTAMGPTISIFHNLKRNPKLTVVVHLNLEEYLLGVLEGEVPVNSWPLEALKAQAIASRSYALHKMKARDRSAYDVESTVFDQVFKPGTHHPAILYKAINATLGLAVTAKGKLFPTYFHSTCGGHTTSATETFAGTTAPPKILSGVRCPFCVHSPVHRWTGKISKSLLVNKLLAAPEAKHLRTPGSIHSLSFTGGIGSPPRAKTVHIRFANGSLSLPAPRFRLVVGPGILKSIAIEQITDHGSYFSISGGGFGHGVGLCQFGSQGMAQKGYAFEEILGFYYPSGELTKVYGNNIVESSKLKVQSYASGRKINLYSGGGILRE